MGIILFTLWLTGFFTGEEPHVELFRTFTAKPLFQLVGNLVGIEKALLIQKQNAKKT